MSKLTQIVTGRIQGTIKMKKFLIGILVGILMGWATIGIGNASDSGDARTYKELLRRIISVIEQVQITLKDVSANTRQTAENTLAIKKKMGAE